MRHRWTLLKEDFKGFLVSFFGANVDLSLQGHMDRVNKEERNLVPQFKHLVRELDSRADLSLMIEIHTVSRRLIHLAKIRYALAEAWKRGAA